MPKKLDNTNILLKHIIEAIQDIKGKEIISLDLTKIDVAICKFFIICTGASNTHVNAIEGNIKKNILKNVGEKPWHIEGTNTGEWVLMDYTDVVVHIFQKDIRSYYNIEDLWGDAKSITYKAS